jgi:hypothetical protein
MITTSLRPPPVLPQHAGEHRQLIRQPQHRGLRHRPEVIGDESQPRQRAQQWIALRGALLNPGEPGEEFVVPRDKATQALPRCDQALVRELGIWLAIGRTSVEDDQPRLGETLHDLPFRARNLRLKDALADSPIRAAAGSADQPQQYTVENLGRGAGKLGSSLFGESVQCAADATHFVVAHKGQGLLALGLP